VRKEENVTRHLLILAALAGLTVLVGRSAFADKEKKVSTRVFELRIYHAAPGKMKALHERFRNHTCKLFKKHGMELIAFWSPQDPKDAEQRLIYVLAYPSKEAAEASWKAFRSDPEWLKVRDESEKDGKLVAKIESVYMDPTDYSAMK
jgi:hypothetical protein